MKEPRPNIASLLHSAGDRHDAYEIGLLSSAAQALRSREFVVVGFSDRDAQRIADCLSRTGGRARAQAELPGAGEACDLIVVDSGALGGLQPTTRRPMLVVGDVPALGELEPEPWLDFMAAPLKESELLLRCGRLLTLHRQTLSQMESFDAAAQAVIGVSEPGLALQLQATLEQAGLECVVATSGDGLLPGPDEGAPDVVVLDSDLGEDGFSLLQALRRDFRLRQTPVVFLISGRQEAAVLRAFALGATDVMRKPVHVTEFEARVVRCLKRPVASTLTGF